MNNNTLKITFNIFFYLTLFGLTYVMYAGYKAYQKDEVIFKENFFSEKESKMDCIISDLTYTPGVFNGISMGSGFYSLKLNCPIVTRVLDFHARSQFYKLMANKKKAEMLNKTASVEYSVDNGCLLSFKGPISFTTSLKDMKDLNQKGNLAQTKCQRIFPI